MKIKSRFLKCHSIKREEQKRPAENPWTIHRTVRRKIRGQSTGQSVGKSGVTSTSTITSTITNKDKRKIYKRKEPPYQVAPQYVCKSYFSIGLKQCQSGGGEKHE
ncbi:hypothetical protein ADH70_003495 [Blautia pseudococcoides]|uniref:Uncharacterized protein n=1 Tax=Blautia pseudococcoides TaxID=1796616 RepID=A0A1C7I6F6_9FIRM|nr:hypothetical protein A4V09_05135 [Blautia pseudococcoides]ASU28006.1 hypothetical protein ADH70_003495 [Blautia pseudococcoides]